MWAQRDVGKRLLFVAVVMNVACVGEIVSPAPRPGGAVETSPNVMTGPDPVPVVALPRSTIVRRLNRAEYENTVAQLLGLVGWNGDHLPADPDGFDTDSATTTTAPDVIERYMDVAEDL